MDPVTLLRQSGRSSRVETSEFVGDIVERVREPARPMSRSL
jgi:hypothetical protein